MRRRRIAVVFVGLALVGLVLSMATPGFAIPYFARKFDTGCQTCHSVVPKLNQTGMDFRTRGYRLPGFPQKRTVPLAAWLSARYENRTDADVDKVDVVVTIVGGAALASSTISSINIETGVVTFTAAQATSTAVTIHYTYAKSSPTTNIYRGDILLTSDAAAQGTNSDGVWVQDGDTLTVEYLDSSNKVLDTTTVTVDSLKPSVAGIEPAGGTITSLTTPTVR
ncbi:MAG: hypothetical protein IH849_15725, partial [Acidobacteria bacterium]|nr:hypothetical protein [Acidobacteriota bacterium]